MNRRSFLVIALGAALMAPAIASTLTTEETAVVEPPLGRFDPTQSQGHRLVGLGCGPQRLTLTAMEEDQFPTCDTIDTPQALCGHDDAAACAAYFGDGW